MEIHELVIEMKLLERRLTLYEEKYGILSEDFYVALRQVSWRAMTIRRDPERFQSLEGHLRNVAAAQARLC